MNVELTPVEMNVIVTPVTAPVIVTEAGIVNVALQTNTVTASIQSAPASEIALQSQSPVQVSINPGIFIVSPSAPVHTNVVWIDTSLGADNVIEKIWIDGEWREVMGRIGPAGRGIVSINKTSTVGLIDTYTISYTDGTASTYTVTNGATGDTGPQGIPGVDGSPGADGADGHSPVITWVGTTIYVDGVAGPDLKGDPGASGPTDHANLTHLDYATSGHTGFQGALTAGTNIDITNGVISATGGGVTDHADLSHLAYANSGHTGFQATLSAGTGINITGTTIAVDATADEITYGAGTVQDALDSLLYVPITISSFTLNNGGDQTIEAGSSLLVDHLDWVISKTPTTQTINNVASTSPKTINTTVTSNTSYALAVSDGTTTATSARSVSFLHRRYYGPSATDLSIGTFSQADLSSAGLSSDLSDGHTIGAVTYNCTGGKYPYLIVLGSSVALQCKLNNSSGLDFTAFTTSNITIPDAGGTNHTYTCAKLDNIQNGTITLYWY